jgi:hypothetical protein
LETVNLLEDAVMAYRIVRSPERRVFYIDVGNIPPEDVEQFMQKVMTQMKRNQVVDSDTGRVDLRYNPLSIEEDYFIPTRGGVTGTRLNQLPAAHILAILMILNILKINYLQHSRFLNLIFLEAKEPKKIKQLLHKKIFVLLEQFKDCKDLLLRN